MISRNGRIAILLLVIIASAFIYWKKDMRLGLDLQGGTRLILEAQETKEVAVDQDTVLGVLSVIRERVNGLGVSEPIIHRKGLRQIVVELPGIKNPDRAISLIGETALLEFVEADWAPENIYSLPEDKRAFLIGEDAVITKVIQYGNNGEVISERPIVLKKSVLTGNDLKVVTPGTSNGQPVVNITFKPAAAKKFHQITARNIGRPLAILLDGKVISAPNVNNAIPGGTAYIEGNFTVSEMRDLVIKLKAGSLPVPVSIISNKIIGPTLGQDSISKSKKAGLIGFALVCVYMIFVYRGSGVLATISLMLYLFFSLAMLKLIDATLTLPGIAGIILTVGMAVDANVIIFERIRETLKQGLSLRASIQEGFNKAFVAILDSNITTFIAAVVLFWLGTGTIKGFAVTLSIGILVSMFSAIFITRLALDIITISNKVQSKYLFKD